MTTCKASKDFFNGFVGSENAFRKPGGVVLLPQVCVALLMALYCMGCFSGKVHHYSGLAKDEPISDIKKVGVLPFANESKRRGAGSIVTNIFITEVFKTGLFYVEEKGNIEQFLLREKIRVSKWIDLRQLRTLGKRLNIDAVFMGAVETFSGGDVGGRLPTTKVCIRARLIDVRNGDILWIARHCKKGDDYIIAFDFGQVRTLGSLTKNVIIEMLETIT